MLKKEVSPTSYIQIIYFFNQFHDSYLEGKGSPSNYAKQRNILHPN